MLSDAQFAHWVSGHALGGTGARLRVEWISGDTAPIDAAWHRIVQRHNGLRLEDLHVDGERVRLDVDRVFVSPWLLESVLLPELTGRQAAQGTADGADLDTARRYWLARLADLPPAPPLPTADAGEPRLARRTGALGADEWRVLRKHAENRDVTAEGLLAACFAEVLRTWSGVDRFTLDCRLHPTDTSTLHAVPPPDGTFADRARAVAQRLADDKWHWRFGGELVVRELNRLPDSRGRAEFPVVFTSLLDCPQQTSLVRVGGMALSPHASVELQVRPDGDALAYHWDARTDLFPPGVPDDLFAAFDRLLRALLNDETWSRHWISLVPPGQLAVREQVNATNGPIPDGLLHTALHEHAVRQPDAPAVITSDRTFTYAELARRIAQVGTRLRELGVRPGRLVAVVMEKGWEQIVAAHGVLAAGGAYVPIDASVPEDRLRYLLDHCEVQVVLSQSRLDLPWPEHIRVLQVDGDFDDVEPVALQPLQQTTDLAYVIFTSGSTGLPKGVMVDHRGALNTLTDVNARFGIGRDDRCIALSGLHFDLSVPDTFGMFLVGGAVVVPDASAGLDPRHWSELVAEHGVTFWNSVPALFEMFVLYLRSTGKRDRMASLRLVILAGDWIPVTLPGHARRLNPDLRVIGSGGPTETCIWSVIYPIGDVDPAWRSIPYGRPMTNQRYHVLDERGRPCPDWVAGEIHIASEVGLAQGYWRDSERTAEKFPVESGERRYASGDLGRYLPDGNIEILGRTDFQVKIQGVRIELGEVEAAVAEHPDVRAAVVVASGNQRDAQVLRAFVVWQQQGSVDELREFLRARLPAHLVPPVISELDALPLTRNGKVDRLALAARRGRPGSRQAGPFEQELCAVCADVLGVAHVDPTGDFFHAGGDSRLAVQVASRLSVPPEPVLRALLTSPSLADAATAIERSVR
ncbi:non-ribosomal peptide synthetase [Lentzea aerocolonigenes]|uniref:non-ribosomal peptide synthetase n=1 Tax=Lentzea aerocolonigenes TaxID=68170 RepID=UPI0006918BDA|nr:non-ribosomal peptide synthetase [Lentzea aerocolonigenes]MCP2243440.1 amino acid adenylation domain-containing protein [Lentzea aerocolonigenes]